jgi:GT2 family glycosyltransferase
MDLSIVMINYNTKKLTEQAVQSIFVCKPQISFEIIIIDNSSDRSQQYDKQQAGVIILQNVQNRGFGNACNIGVKKSCGRYVLFLNSDTIMHSETLEQCVAYLDQNPQVGALGERTLLADGTLDHACKRGFPTPSASFCYFTKLDRKFPMDKQVGAYRQTFIDETSISEVDAVAGSFMMMPREVFDKTAGFDESFFMYGP